MTLYLYNQQVTPPAPFVHVTIWSPITGAAMADCPAQLDIAADTTVIPHQAVDTLDLDPLEQIPVMGFGGHIQSVSTFLVRLAIRDCEPLVVRVLASEGEPFVLLGRDVLNRYRLLLDGPQLRLEIS